MKKNLIYFPLLMQLACSHQNNHDYSKEAEQQIISAEKEFEKTVREKGVKEAFLEFADDSAVINRSGRIYVSKKGIEAYFNTLPIKITSLEWNPDYVKSSNSGDMGYTYGQYKLSLSDSAGKETELEGIFHTVWKRQKDGNWKFIYD